MMRFFKRLKNSDLLSKADQPTHRPRKDRVTPEELRQLLDMIRQRHALDLQIWALRKVYAHNHEHVEKEAMRAEALLACIRATVHSMDGRDHFDHESEYLLLKNIKARVMSGGKRDWVKNPPWNQD